MNASRFLSGAIASGRSRMVAAFPRGEDFYVRAIRLWPWAIFFVAALGSRGLLLWRPITVHLNDYFIAIMPVAAACAFVFILVPPSAGRLVKGLEDGRLKYWAVYLISVLLVTNLLEGVFARRVFAGLMLIPVLVMALKLLLRNWRRPDVGLIPATAPFALLVILAVPGFYFPPFYDGIAGWTYAADPKADVITSGYQLVRADGTYVWYSNDFDDPVTQDGRLQAAIRAHQTDPRTIYRYLFAKYKKVFPTLSEGRLPTQRLLGSFAYPPHSLSWFNPSYRTFKPEDIAIIRLIRMKVSPSSQIVGEDVLEAYDVRSDSIVKALE